ncbi:hypothetical protein MKW94_004664 [Papaver nudicaule]|uniref:BTB domain-containing protein n=1 Tax=Papaver nudicaule TaxID=74823 RepID=A0AA41UZP6_PAPNU|nr:hypothetical protein [Papaver nudicaule]
MSPPFEGGNQTNHGFIQKKPETNIISINVGGQLFQTTKQTLALSGSNSILSKISSSEVTIPFIDRDPEIFSILLSLLRTGNLPSKAKVFDLQDLIFEAKFYGIEGLLVNSESKCSCLNLEKSFLLPLNGRDSVSVISTTPYGSVHVAHGSKITSFDWSMDRKSTILTEFVGIDSLVAIDSATAAAGATDFSGMQILDLKNGAVKERVVWENQTRSSSTVQAIGTNGAHLFTSFESGRRNSSSIVVFDINQGFKPVAEIGQHEIYGAEIDTGIPATKLKWVSSFNLLMASGSHGGPSGVTGNVKLWDLRSSKAYWEFNEKADCFADVTVCDDLGCIFKVGVNSGEVYFADMRKLSSEKPWVCIGDERKGFGGKKKEGLGCKIESHGNQVFCSKNGDIELWSEVVLGTTKEGSGDRLFRRNLMGRMKDMGGSRVTQIGFGGNKMIVSRKDEQCVEVWQSSVRGF